MSHHFDLIILGTGPSASRIAEQCAEKLRVAIVEPQAIGGTCALRGCNPKKVFTRAGELVAAVRAADNRYLTGQANTCISWPHLAAYKDTFTDPIPQKSENKLRELGVEIYQGAGRFQSPSAVGVGDLQLDADHFVICTGARPAPLPFPGAEHVTTSDEFMELEQLPQRVLFIGGGFISFEFAHVALRAGSEVSIFDRGPRPLREFDAGLVQRLVRYSRQIGLRVVEEAEVSKIEKHRGELCVTVCRRGEQLVETVDLVVHGAGRVPDIDDMNLEQGNIEFGSEGIVVDEYMRSVSNPRVYAAGDAADDGEAKLTPVANEQGRTVAQNLLHGNLHAPDYGVVPQVVFTTPSLAGVGLTQEQAEKEQLNVEIREGDMSDWGSVRKVNGECAMYKIILDRSTDQILGAHLLGPQASETINLFALAMKFHLTAAQVKSVLFAFPTFAADVRSMV